MQFTGSQLSLKRNFYTQSGNYGMVMTVTVDNTTGVYHFGLSGSAGVLDFRLESGRMYYDNQFVQTYRSYEQFTVEAQFTSGNANVSKNDDALAYGIPKATGYVDYVYFNRASTDMGATFDALVSGDSPAVYTISQQGYLFSTGQNAVTGYFSNQGAFPIQVFDTSIQASANYDLGKLAGNVARNGSGAFAFSGDYNVLDFSQPILTTFATNFGTASVLFTITDARSYNSFVQLTAPTSFGFNTDNVFNTNVSYLNFSGGVVSNDFNTNLTFMLGYVSGSGDFGSYTKSFTGSWQFATGGSPSSLVQFTPVSDTLYSGSGVFAPNSFLNLQINYTPSGTTPDGAYLIITGANVINGINQLISLP